MYSFFFCSYDDVCFSFETIAAVRILEKTTFCALGRDLCRCLWRAIFQEQGLTHGF